MLPVLDHPPVFIQVSKHERLLLHPSISKHAAPHTMLLSQTRLSVGTVHAASHTTLLGPFQFLLKT